MKAREVTLKNRVLAFAAASTMALLGSSTALGQTSQAAAQQSTHVPFNVGLVPYVDVNSHFHRARNNVSVDAIAGSAWGLEGAAIAGVSGFVWGDARGLQVGGVSGYVGGDLAGAQIGGVVSATRGRVSGLQVAGAVNYAGSADGVQIGVVNVGGNVQGTQIGVVNVGGRVRGAQVGLVNVADEVHGAPIGLLSVVRRNARHQIELSTSNTTAFSAALKLGTRHVYSILGMGLQPAGEKVAWMPTFGFGGSIPIEERGFLNIEALARAVNVGAEFDRETVLGQLRLAGGYRVSDKLSLFGGPVLDALRRGSNKKLSDISYLPTLVTLKSGRTSVDMGLGFVVGVEAL